MTDEEKRAAEEQFWKQREEDIAMWKAQEYNWADYERVIAENIAPFTIYMKISEDAAELSKLASTVARKGLGGPQIDIFDKSYELLRREYFIAQMNLAQCIRILYSVYDRHGKLTGHTVCDLMDEVENSDLGLKRAMQWVEDIGKGKDSYTRGEIYHDMYLRKRMLDGTKKESKAEE